MKRKEHKGKVYDKERTKARLIAAVGKIVVKEGFQQIRINKVERISKVSKKMIYEYFGDLQGLIKAYLNQVDYWKLEEQKMNSDPGSIIAPINKEFMAALLRNDFEYLFNSVEMQKIILWSISEKNKTIRELSDEREALGERIFAGTDQFFNNTEVDYRAIIAILVAATYYTVLHVKNNGSTMCGIDVATTEGKARITSAMERLLHLTHQYANVKV
ncbi:TetR/AcrR family transcriptional regulator [Niabella hibiscisoli]|uniref:TetR/AcrR family transcriptional regulator n=1 Tax=Niabella hibiscisoli TaxID=1825928 RepID=UPI001F0EBF9D|nr:TetR/AcrR family transcriptional regulator [Niabella hibiscisoli]MCH5719520.1 TetR/AcrR family transcriptional regulator [Niabella hibiscisoli]